MAGDLGCRKPKKNKIQGIHHENKCEEKPLCLFDEGKRKSPNVTIKLQMGT